MVDSESGSFNRRQLLRYGGVGVLGGIAGCSGGGSEEADDPEDDADDDDGEPDDSEASTQTGQPDGTPADSSGCGPGETALGSLPDEGSDVVVTGEVTTVRSDERALYIDDGTAAATVRSVRAQEYSVGECVTVTGFVDGTIGISGEPPSPAVTAYEVRTQAEVREDVLGQSIPDPSQYIASRQSEFERAVGTVEITTEPGNVDFILRGPGSNQVTAISGYVDGAGLAANPNWGGSVDQESGFINTSAGEASDSLRLDVFRGVALRAVAGIDLVVDGTTVAESVRLVRYRQDDGVFESEPVEE